MGDPRTKGGTEEDVGLQVGPLMWRWPSLWPFAEDFFSTQSAEPALEYYTSNPDTAPVLTGENLALIQVGARDSYSCHAVGPSRPMPSFFRVTWKGTSLKAGAYST